MLLPALLSSYFCLSESWEGTEHSLGVCWQEYEEEGAAEGDDGEDDEEDDDDVDGDNQEYVEDDEEDEEEDEVRSSPLALKLCNSNMWKAATAGHSRFAEPPAVAGGFNS